MKRPFKKITHTGMTLDSWESPDKPGQVPNKPGQVPDKPGQVSDKPGQDI